MSSRESRALLVDDHPIVTNALQTSLIALNVFQHIDQRSDLDSALQTMDENGVYDLVVLDLNLGSTTGAESVRRMRESHPDTPIVIFSGDERTETIAKSYELGVQGYVHKNKPITFIVSVIKDVLAGKIFIPDEVVRMLGFDSSTARAHATPPVEQEFQLSPRQKEVLTCSLQGVPNKVIAARLGMAEGTVKSHLNIIYRVFGVRSRARLILKARAYGIS